MSKSKEELQQEYAENEARAEQYRHRNERIENRIRYLTDGDRKKRVHRFITRGAAVESVAPEARDMGEAAFFNLVEEIFSLPEVRRLVQSAAGKEGD